MTITKNLVQAVLRDPQLKNTLLKKINLNQGQVDILGFLKDNKSKEILIYTMLDDYLDFTYEYPHPINPSAQLMNPVKIVGVKGAYLVIEDYQEINSAFTFFVNKNKAVQYANKAYQTFLLKNKLLSIGRGLKPYRN